MQLSFLVIAEGVVDISVITFVEEACKEPSTWVSVSPLLATC